MTGFATGVKRAIALPLALAAVYGLVSGTAGAVDGTITVCPAGPPTCDHALIQDGIDAASTGDTVLVHAGTYTGNLVFKSGVALQSSDGPPSTTITALQGPVISGTSVLSGLIEGFTIQRQSPISPATGIELLDSDVTVSNCVIEGLEAEDCLPAYGIRAQGGSVVITGTVVRWLWGGDGEYVIGPYECRCLGGDAGGIYSANTTVEVYDSQFEDLWAGGPCERFSATITFWDAGDAIAVRVMGGSAMLRGNVATRLTVSDRGEAGAYAVYTSGTAETRLEATTITRTLSYDGSTAGSSSEVNANPNAPVIPGTPPLGPHAVGIRSAGDAVLYAANTTVVDWSGAGRGGYARAVEVEDTGHVTLTGNTFTGMHGGYDGTNYGIRILRADAAHVEANVIEGPFPQRAPAHIYDYDSGSTVGVDLQSVATALVADNTISSLRGPDGQVVEDSVGFGSAGNARAVLVQSGSARVRNNTVYDVSAGIGELHYGKYKAADGYAAGLHLAGDAEVLALNNAIISASVGISSTGSLAPILAFNDLWANETDYGEEISPGIGDLHVDPAFANAQGGDFRLLPFSPLIDAGTNLLLLDEDFEGEVRHFAHSPRIMCLAAAQ